MKKTFKYFKYNAWAITDEIGIMVSEKSPFIFTSRAPARKFAKKCKGNVHVVECTIFSKYRKA